MARVTVTDNADFVFAKLRALSKPQVHTFTLLNNKEYAGAVHDIEGISVFNVDVTKDFIRLSIEEMMSKGIPPTKRNIERALEAAGWEIMDWHRSYIDEVAPPLRAGGPDRPKHPTGFADVSHNLKNAFRFRVNNRAEDGSSLEGAL